MSTTVKGMLIRSTGDVYAQRVLLKHKYVDHNQIDLLSGHHRPLVHVNRQSRRVRLARHQEQQISANGFSNPTPKKGEMPFGSRLRSQPIRSPVSDPMPTMKKVCKLIGK